jgi:hypothetical protein
MEPKRDVQDVARQLVDVPHPRASPFFSAPPREPI